jgi:hypothetical protein
LIDIADDEPAEDEEQVDEQIRSLEECRRRLDAKQIAVKLQMIGHNQKRRDAPDRRMRLNFPTVLQCVPPVERVWKMWARATRLGIDYCNLLGKSS